MKKKDLKTGMTVKDRDGEIFMVLLETPLGDVLIGNAHDNLNNYNKDLFNDRNKSSDIIEVFTPTYKYTMMGCSLKDQQSIWKREEEKPILKLDGVEYSEDTLRSLIKKATN